MKLRRILVCLPVGEAGESLKKRPEKTTVQVLDEPKLTQGPGVVIG